MESKSYAWQACSMIGLRRTENISAYLEWWDYDSKNNELIESAHESKQESIQIKVEKRFYTIYFDHGAWLDFIARDL